MKRLLLLLALLVIPLTLQAVISIQTTAVATVTTGQAMTVSVNVGSGSQRALVTCFTGLTDYTGLTAKYAAPMINNVNNGSYNQMFYLLNPTSGTNNLVFSWTTSASVFAGIVVYNGVNALGTPTTSQPAAGGTSATNTLTTVFNNSYQFGWFGYNSSVAFSAPTGTQYYNASFSAPYQIAGQGKACTTPGTYNLVYTKSTQGYAIMGVELQQATATPTFTITPTYTVTKTVTPTFTITPTYTVTETVTPTYTITPPLQ